MNLDVERQKFEAHYGYDKAPAKKSADLEIKASRWDAWQARAALAPQWISVEERLPAPSSGVLFWTTDGTWESGYFRADYGEDVRWECERTGPQDDRIDFNEYQVTHWMVPPSPGRETKKVETPNDNPEGTK